MHKKPTPQTFNICEQWAFGRIALRGSVGRAYRNNARGKHTQNTESEVKWTQGPSLSGDICWAWSLFWRPLRLPKIWEIQLVCHDNVDKGPALALTEPLGAGNGFGSLAFPDPLLFAIIAACSSGVGVRGTSIRPGPASVPALGGGGTAVIGIGSGVRLLLPLLLPLLDSCPGAARPASGPATASAASVLGVGGAGVIGIGGHGGSGVKLLLPLLLPLLDSCPGAARPASGPATARPASVLGVGGAGVIGIGGRGGSGVKLLLPLLLPLLASGAGAARPASVLGVVGTAVIGIGGRGGSGVGLLLPLLFPLLTSGAARLCVGGRAGSGGARWPLPLALLSSAGPGSCGGGGPGVIGALPSGTVGPVAAGLIGVIPAAPPAIGAIVPIGAIVAAPPPIGAIAAGPAAIGAIVGGPEGIGAVIGPGAISGIPIGWASWLMSEGEGIGWCGAIPAIGPLPGPTMGAAPEGWGPIVGAGPAGPGAIIGAGPAGPGAIIGAGPAGPGAIIGAGPAGPGAIIGAAPEGRGPIIGAGPEGPGPTMGAVPGLGSEGPGAVPGLVTIADAAATAAWACWLASSCLTSSCHRPVCPCCTRMCWISKKICRICSVCLSTRRVKTESGCSDLFLGAMALKVSRANTNFGNVNWVCWYFDTLDNSCWLECGWRLVRLSFMGKHVCVCVWRRYGGIDHQFPK